MSKEGNLHAETPLDSATGYVTDVSLSGGRIYSGSVSEGCMCGPGKLITEAYEYTGNFFRDFPHGHGVFRAGVNPHPSGVRIYDGAWRLGKRHGTGHIMWNNGDTYAGEFVQNSPHGAGGCYTFADGRVYVGDFYEGRRHGTGRLTQHNGDYYDGEFVHGLITGKGTASYSRARGVFVGQWAKGKKVRGRIVFADSQRMYDGEWQGGRPHGKGEMVFSNGDHYTGEFVAGKLHGVGCITYHSLGGKVYCGTFMHDQPHGKGMITMPSGCTMEGYYREGKQLAEDDTVAVEEVLCDVRVLGDVGLSVMNHHEVCEGSISGSVSTTQPPSGNSSSSAEDLSQVYTLSTDGGCNKKGGCNSKSDSREDVSDVRINAMGELLLKDLGFLTPVPPSIEPPAPPEEVKGGGTSLPSKEEGKEILELVSPVIFGITSGGCKGWLQKFSIGRSLVGFSNWRRRYFVLALFNSVVCLSYYKDELCQSPVALLRLDAHDTRIITRPSTRTHKEASGPGCDICVIYTEREKEYKLLLRADSEDVHEHWANAFRKFFDIVDFPFDYPLLYSSPQ